MEELRSLEALGEIDERHILLGQIRGRIFDKNSLHAAVSAIEINESAPDEIRSQFNVARNLALYSYYCYSFAPVVQAATFTIIEFALKIKDGSTDRQMLKRLLKKAVDNDWICDSGFRHLKNPSANNEYCRSLVELIPCMRNDFAHGTNQLTPHFMDHLSICADFVNQLFPAIGASQDLRLDLLSRRLRMWNMAQISI